MWIHFVVLNFCFYNCNVNLIVTPFLRVSRPGVLKLPYKNNYLKRLTETFIKVKDEKVNKMYIGRGISKVRFVKIPIFLSRK